MMVILWDGSVGAAMLDIFRGLGWLYWLFLYTVIVMMIMIVIAIMIVIMIVIMV